MRKFTLLPTTEMSHPNHLRLFNELRLSPWVSEHDLYIRQRIAALEYEDKIEADRKRLQYAKIYAEYLQKHPEEAIAELPEEIKIVVEKAVEEKTETVKTETVEPLEKPTKRGRKPKISSPI